MVVIPTKYDIKNAAYSETAFPSSMLVESPNELFPNQPPSVVFFSPITRCPGLISKKLQTTFYKQ